MPRTEKKLSIRQRDRMLTGALEQMQAMQAGHNNLVRLLRGVLKRSGPQTFAADELLAGSEEIDVRQGEGGALVVGLKTTEAH